MTEGVEPVREVLTEEYNIWFDYTLRGGERGGRKRGENNHKGEVYNGTTQCRHPSNMDTLFVAILYKTIP